MISEETHLPAPQSATVIDLPTEPPDRERLRRLIAHAGLERVSSLANAAAPSRPATKNAHKKQKSEKRKKAERGLGSRRGIETFYRTAYDTHLTLHAMADNKARMMIQVNGLILSVLLALGSRFLGLGLTVEPPAMVLCGFGALSLIFAVLAARPGARRANPRTDAEDVRGGGLAFFSQFSALDVESYVAAMRRLSHEPEALYENMSRNLHAMGQSLESKYTLLRISYGALAVGVVTACTLWLLAPDRWMVG